jgi:gluconate 2-dehydrogenase alpha chain
MAKVLPKVEVVIVGVGWAGGIIAAELTESTRNFGGKYVFPNVGRR